MKSLIHPLNLEASLQGANSRAGWVPWVDCLLIGLGFILIGSRFLFAPGVAIQLPAYTGPLPGKPVAAVLSVRSENMFIFEDAVFTAQGLRSYLGSSRRQDASVDRGVLLVQVDRDVDMQTFLDLCETAYLSGFSEIQIAAVERDVGPGEGV